MFEALRLLDCEANEVVSFGDRAIDIIASNKAGIMSVACTWGTTEAKLILSSGCSRVISSPEEIITFFR